MGGLFSDPQVAACQTLDLRTCHTSFHSLGGPYFTEGGVTSSLPPIQRRCRDLKAKGILFVGSGVSGGEDGARYGPSLMPGGNKAAW